MGRTIALCLIATLMTACVVGDSTPSDDELAELDGWASTADGKADLPGAWHELVAWLRDVYTNKMSAIWNNQEHPRSADAALTRIRDLVRAAGVEPSTAKFSTTVQRHIATVDHSEVNVALPGGKVVRLVGDPKGAGVFFDRARFKAAIGPRLCLTWSELEAAVRAAYVDGAYAATYVCHTVTERVLRALDVGTAAYASQFRTYSSARWIWGPSLPSFNSQDPSDWRVSRSCD